MSTLHKTLIFTVCCGLLVAGYLLPMAFAQVPSPQIIFTWQAHNFYPSNYSGKAAATINTSIVISATVIRNNRFVDISKANFIWYIDGRFFSRGSGLSEIVLKINKLRGDESFVRMSIDLDGERIEGSFTVPVSGQRTVIEVPSPNNIVFRKRQIVFHAVPYFFNVVSFDNFEFFWSIDNKNQPKQRSNRLVLNIGDSSYLLGEEVLISNTTSNSLNLIETTRTNIRFTIQ